MDAEENKRSIYRLRWHAVYLAAGHKNLKSFAAWIGVTEQHLHYVIFRGRESERLWNLLVEKLGYDPRKEDGKELEGVFHAMAFGHPATARATPPEPPPEPPPAQARDYYQQGRGDTG